MKLKYMDVRIAPNWVPIIADANKILEHAKSLDIKITLRGVYYRFIAGDLFPDSWIDEAYNLRNGLAKDTKNTHKNYKRLGVILADARMAGLVDWDHLQDITRNTDQQFHWDNYEGETPGQIIRQRANAFFLDRWSNSPYHVELMGEKDAIEGILGPVAEQYDVPFTSSRGYASITAQRNSGLRLARAARKGKKIVVLYVGDHDPSGIDMTRELQVKLELFSGQAIEMKRLALNMDQIDEYNPPTNPVKLTDKRAPGYMERFGDDSWEVDALDFEVLQQIVRDAIEEYVDEDLVAVIEAKEEAYQDKMNRLADIVDRAMAEEGDEDEE